MAVPNSIAITWGDFTVGGILSGYQLDGPYVIEKSFTTLRLTFTVLVVASGVSSLQAASEALEDAYQKRDQDLSISMGGDSWSYEHGTDILNSVCSATKTGNPDTDRGGSRAYSVTISGELPANDRDGLRDLDVNVDFTPARQQIVTMRGSYTAFEGTKASEQYTNEFDAEAATILSGVGEGPFELVDEQRSQDRNDHLCTFSRQYMQVISPQSAVGLDDPNIVDHRVQFTDLSQHPGDSRPGVFRMRRVIGTYDCSVIIEAGALRQVWDSTVRPHIIELFRSGFSPQVFCIEEARVSFDETGRRISASLQFLYQKSGGDKVVEVTQSVAIREQRTIDYTPVHNQDEFAFEADVGWASRERVWQRTVYVIGTETPKRRLGDRANLGDAGPWGATAGEQDVDQQQDGTVKRDGWNIISNTSQVEPRWVGDPDTGQQIQMAMLVENVVERWHKKPSGGGPITPGGS